jgi:hypothetical protein
VHLYQRLAGDRLLVSGGIHLPSGKKELTEEELRVVQALNQPLRGFRLKQYGAGLDATLGIAIQVPFGSGIAGGLGLGWTHRGEYKLSDSGLDLKPASELTVSAGLETTRRDAQGPGRSARLGLTWHSFGNDEEDGRTVFEEGDQIDLQGQVRIGSEAVQGYGSALLLLKADNTSQSATLEKIKSSSGTGVFAHAGLQTRLRDGWFGGLEGEMRRFSGSDALSRDGHALGVGPTLSAGLGRQQATIRALYLWGSEKAGDGSDRKTHGLSVALSLGLRAD